MVQEINLNHNSKFLFFISQQCLGLDMVVRDDNGNILDINATSTTQLYEQHVQATDRIRRATVSLNIYVIEFMRLIEFSFIYTFCPLNSSYNLIFIYLLGFLV